MTPAGDDDHIENVARALCSALGHDPDLLVLITKAKEIKIIDTPSGEAWHYAYPAEPLWMCWKSQAQKMIAAGLIKE